MVTWWGTESWWYPQSWLHFSANMLGVKKPSRQCRLAATGQIFQDSSIARVFFDQFQLVNLLFSTYWKEKWRLFSGSIWFVFLNYNDGWIHRMPLWSPFQLLSWPGSWKMHVWSNLIPRWHGRLASSLLVGHWYGYVHRQEVLQLIETSCVWMSIYLKSIQPSNRPR